MTKAELFFAMLGCAYVAVSMASSIAENQGDVLRQVLYGTAMLVNAMYSIRFLGKLLILIGDGMQQK